MSTLSSPSATDHLEALAGLLHDALPPDPEPHAVFVAQGHGGHLELGLRRLPAFGLHPVDGLVGYRAPASWLAFGIAAGGRARPLGPGAPAGAPSGPVRIAYLASRLDGDVAVLDGSDGAPLRLAEAPSGVVPDIVGRVLGRPTPPPAHTTARLVEATWLDRLAADLLGAPAGTRSWRWLSDRHPLGGGGRAIEAAVLNDRTRSYAQAHPWARWRRVHGARVLPAARLEQGPGTILRLGRWFDDGSLERWLLRDLPPPRELLEDLLSMLPTSVGDQLCEALVGVAVPPR